MRHLLIGASLALVLVCAFPASSLAQPPAPAPANELDAFMAKVLARRDTNRQTLQQYILDDAETFEILGPGRAPLHRGRRDYSWYVRDGLHVRSPVRYDGVTVGEEDRRKYEEDWIRRERARLERRARRSAEKAGTDPAAEPAAPPVDGDTPVATPRFVSEAYFMDFKFEAGNYYLAGREKLEGHDVLRVEYYPTRMFDDNDDRDRDDSRKADRPAKAPDARQRQQEENINRKMNKTALVTLWIDPAEHQIVKYTFDNVWMDFLPGAWLVRVDDIHASMSMGQPFAGIWLPREMDVHAAVSLATGPLEASYSRQFTNYRLAEVKSIIRTPKLEVHEVHEVHGVQGSGFKVQGSGFRVQGSGFRVQGSGFRVQGSGFKVQGSGFKVQGSGFRVQGSGFRVQRSRFSVPGSGFDAQRSRFAAKRSDELREPSEPVEPYEPHEPHEPHEPYEPSQTEVVREIRVHGNAAVLDEDVIKLAGLTLGQVLAEGALEAIEQRLTQSGKFESVEVRKRYRSLTDAGDVAVVLLVHERAGTFSSGGAIQSRSRPLGRVGDRLMFLPIVNYTDGYGLTYGARMSTLGLLGAGERLSVPLTWGGTRRAALEFDRTFKRGPLTRVESSVAIWQRENPRFELDDRRVELKARAERRLRRFVRTGVQASRSSVDFGGTDDGLWTIGADAALDTRADPAFPRNAVVLSAGWTGLHVRSAPARIDLYNTDARGYVGVIGQAVAAARVQYTAASASLPAFERLLLGGASTLRGFGAGRFDGDRMLVTSGELRVPISSVLSAARLGVLGFVDAATAWDAGTRAAAARWHTGVGGGVFLLAPLVKLNLDVAHGLDDGDTRLHLGVGFAF